MDRLPKEKAMLRNLALGTAVAAALLLPTAAFSAHGHGGGHHGGGHHGGGHHGGGHHGHHDHHGHHGHNGHGHHGGHGHYGHYWHGRYYSYGVGSCWSWSNDDD